MNTPGLRILVVDDDDGIRESLCDLLRDEGYEVETSATAEDGLRLLRRRRFDLLITDYALPGETGAWLVQQARSEKLLDGAEALLITAHPSPKGADGLRVFRKPVDVDDFLRQVHTLLAPARQDELERAKKDLGEASGGPGKKTLATVELTLYISSASPSSMRAVRNLQRLLASYESGSVRVSIADLSKPENHAQADVDRIAFTPTLVRKAPEPRVWVLGDLENDRLVSELLHQAGLEPLRRDAR